MNTMLWKNKTIYWKYTSICLFNFVSIHFIHFPVEISKSASCYANECQISISMNAHPAIYPDDNAGVMYLWPCVVMLLIVTAAF